jgi:transposase
VSSEAEEEIRALRRKVSELERTIEILSAATGFFAREHDPLRR